MKVALAAFPDNLLLVTTSPRVQSISGTQLDNLYLYYLLTSNLYV